MLSINLFNSIYVYNIYTFGLTALAVINVVVYGAIAILPDRVTPFQMG